VLRICGYNFDRPIFAVLERWLLGLQLRETDSSFVFIIFAVLLGKVESV